jgi:hypothetical protein
MDIKIEILISSIFILFVLIGAIRIKLFNKDNEGLIVGLMSMLSIIFGIYLWLKNGLILDYGTVEEVTQSHASIMFELGITNILIWLIFIVIPIIKYIVWKIKKAIA